LINQYKYNIRGKNDEIVNEVKKTEYLL
jgi:hypothetical protein